MKPLLLALALSGCAPHSWVVRGCPEAWAPEALRIAAIAHDLDKPGGYVRAGGEIRCWESIADMDRLCFAEPGWHRSGCSSAGEIQVLVGGPFAGMPARDTALAHEFSHLLYNRRGTLTSPAYVSNEAEAEFGAAAILTLLGPP